MKQRLLLFNVVLRLFLLPVFVVPILTQAQKENNIWYFGNGAGIDFNSGSPVALTNGALNTTEGCASIADPITGDLLFYTDGVTVYNKVHNVMTNGIGLLGGYSSTQSAIIVPLPGSSTLYYIFTTPNQGMLDGLNYSVVDMSLQGGLGEVTILNSLLHAPIGEKVCATHHSNGIDFWIVAHEYATDAFYAFLLTAAGVNLVPVISNIGLVHNGYHGYLKFTPDGTKIGLAVGETDELELFDFDRATGVVSNPITFPTTYLYPYGVEFSPDNSKFYIAQSGVGNPNGIYQFDMLAGSPAAIIASGQLVGTSSNIYMGPLQLGPDGKIYCARYQTGYIGVIDNPNAMGVACNYIDSAVSLNGNISMFGLPNQIPRFDFVPTAIFTADNHICPGTCTDFTNLSQNATSFIWTFPGGNPGLSTDANPTQICYNIPGQYSVTLIATNANGSDTLMLPNFMTVYPQPAPQGIMQSGDTLFANQGAVSYQWFYSGVLIPGATDYFYVAPQSGNFNVVATDANGCEVEAAIFDIIAGLTPTLSKGEGVVLFPNPVADNLTIQWKTVAIGEIQIEIYNAGGVKVYSGSEEFNLNPVVKIDVREFAAGLYCLKMNQGSKTFTTKFIKE